MRVEHFSLTLLTRYRTKFRGFFREAYRQRPKIPYNMLNASRKKVFGAS